MITAPLLVRITDCLQRQHDLNIEMQALAEEFADHTKRSSEMTARIQASLKGGLDAQVMRLPRVLASGPTRRGDGVEHTEPVECA